MTRAAQLPVIATDAPPTVDRRALEESLRAGFTGEIRLDRLSRALYSTDASVYQIVPLGVVLPKTEADIEHVVRTCGQFRVPLTARGGGTSQAGQAIGPGLVMDCSKYFNEIIEINPAGRWVRLRPGCVLDDLNLALKPHGLHFPIDISTSNRATLGGMIANNSSGTRSVIYGKTIDHVRALRVVLADGTLAEFRGLDDADWERKAGQQDLEGAAHEVVRRLVREHAEEIGRRFPKVLRRVGGYNLDRFCPGRAGGVNPPGTDGDVVTPASDRGVNTPRAPGLNLSDLIVGSEGTLALVLEARLNVVPLPTARAVVVVHFAELLDSLAATPVILEHGPSAVEVTDRYILDSTKRNADAARLRGFIQGDPGSILIVEFYGETAEEAAGKVERLVTDLKQRGFGYHFHLAPDAASQAAIWKLRKLSLGLSMLEKGDAKAISFVEDTAVAPERLRDYIAEFLEIIRKHQTTAGVYAHASVGCLHVRPVVNLKTDDGVRKFEAIAGEVAELVLKYGGALSGEHGDGLVRSPFMERMFGPVLYQAFREIKRTFDPLGILNPGKIVDAPPLTRNLRYGPAYPTPTVPTLFDFAADGGIAQAAELCAGVGECRKKSEGSMCPSYRATCDEQHSTRGRANVLRLALTGQLDFAGLTDDAVKEALDLCLECKACKSECPTNVDMARLKAEFLHQQYQKHGLPWRNWLFGNVAMLAKWHVPLAPVANWLGRTGAVRWLNEKLFGIDRRRVPPALASPRSFVEALEEELQHGPGRSQKEFNELVHAETLPAESKPQVLLFADTFVRYFETGLGRAASRLLRALDAAPVTAWPDVKLFIGMRKWLYFPAAPPEIWPTDVRCCGRPMISNGMLDKAVRHARHNVERLFPWAACGKPIVACEPSCILTIKDDYPALLRGEERAKAETVAAMCMTFEEFLESTLASGAWQRPGGIAESSTGGLTPPARLAFRPGPKKILVQAHCHQRSLVGMRPIMSLLKRIPGAEVIDLDAGCCGMAGSFGYEKEHYEISRLVGEQALFPAIRRADPDTVIVAPGFSCRLQIKHFTGRMALHPAELLFSLLDEPAGASPRNT